MLCTSMSMYTLIIILYMKIDVYTHLHVCVYIDTHTYAYILHIFFALYSCTCFAPTSLQNVYALGSWAYLVDPTGTSCSCMVTQLLYCWVMYCNLGLGFRGLGVLGFWGL